jgi:hypothetical protein
VRSHASELERQCDYCQQRLSEVLAPDDGHDRVR